jgi:hypothetical protein
MAAPFLIALDAEMQNNHVDFIVSYKVCVENIKWGILAR